MGKINRIDFIHKKSMNKKIYLFLLIIIYWSCLSNSKSEKYHNKKSNVINIRSQIKEIIIDDLLINNYSWLQIIDKYLFIKDYKSANEFIHIFNKNDFGYITSTAFKGQP